MANDLLSFGFNNERERSTMIRGRPWLFEGALLILAAANDLTHPFGISLKLQEFWVQVKELPLVYMTRQIAKFVGNHLGTYVVMD